MQLTFLGAAMMVTGSSYLLEADDKKILIDCGMFQGSKEVTLLNRRDFLFDPAEIDCVLLTHAHIDHSGLLPKLYKEGFKGKIYATKATTDLAGIMLPDSAHIQEFDTEIANRKGRRAGRGIVEPLYTVDDAYECLQRFMPVAHDTPVSLSTHISVSFRDAGHILGSAILEIWVVEGDLSTKLVFSGDLGQLNQPIVKDPTIIESADYIITEATYGNRLHHHYDKKEMLAQVINETVRRGGNLIIPAFAVGRTQTLLYYLHELLNENKIPDIPIFIDSPLAISATEIFLHNPQEYDKETRDMFIENNSKSKHLDVSFTKTADESKMLNKLEQPAIIISASGMAEAGRILHHLKHNLWRPEAGILFVGYQAEGSMGRRLLDGEKRVRIMGEDISVKATIYNIDGFSAHADQKELLEWLGHFKEKPANVFVIHGETEATEVFAALIKEKLDMPAYIPRYGDAAVLHGREWHVEPSQITVVAPPLQQLRDYISQIEEEFTAYRHSVEKEAADNMKNVPDIMQRLERIRTVIRRTAGKE
ncbi:MAG: Beta-Casp domain containing protein [Firmicutes bacterium]|nr:Beta-Casp domain containing protein [Bacillota bacterium]